MELGEPKWGARLTVLWIAFAGLYSKLGDIAPTRAVSTLMLLCGGVLVIAVVIHTLRTDAIDQKRSLLLVAFGATVFGIGTSYEKFGDTLGAGASATWAAMTGCLLWTIEADRYGRAHRLKIRFIGVMAATLTSCVLLFPWTLFVKRHFPETYVVGQVGYGLFVGFFIAALSARSSVLYPRGLAEPDAAELRLRPLATAVAVGLICLAYAWYSRFGSIPLGPGQTLALALTGPGLATVLFVAFMNEPAGANWFVLLRRWSAGAALPALGGACGLVSGLAKVLLVAAAGDVTLAAQIMAVELVTGCLFGAALALAARGLGALGGSPRVAEADHVKPIRAVRL